MAVREGRWNCTTCNTAGIRGRFKFCPNCGANRGSAHFYLPEGEPVVTDAARLKEANAGADWICRSCQAANGGDHSFCTECGTDKDAAPSRPALVSHAEVERSLDHALEDSPRWRSSENWRTQEMKGRASIFVSVVVIALFGFILWAIFHQTEVKVHIDSFLWDRTVYIDHYATVREGDWGVPATGRLVNSESRIHHYVQVYDHTEYDTESYACGSESYSCGSTDNGNGYFTDRTCSRTTYCNRQVSRSVYRDDPVYATWYNYDIDKWTAYRDVPTSGTNRDDPPPYWGAFNLNCVNQTVIHCERENRRGENYIVVFIDPNKKTYNYRESLEDWNAYDAQAEYRIVYTSFGIVNDPLHPEEKK